MPMLQKVHKGTSSYYIVLPKKWCDHLAKIHGREIEEVLVEVDNKLIIEPVLEKLRRR